jgi:hypothetical protein
MARALSRKKIDRSIDCQGGNSDIKGLKNPDLLVMSPALFHITELDTALKSICMSLQTENN